MIPLGKKVRDKVTGFEGIASGRITYLTGCSRYIVTPNETETARPTHSPVAGLHG